MDYSLIRGKNHHTPCARAAWHVSWLHIELIVFGWGGESIVLNPKPQTVFSGLPGLATCG